MPATRQLAAILFADIQGYTALMQDDEVKAMIIREKFQKTLTNEIKSHNGRIIQFSGDGALCIFQSAIEAIHAAIEIQKQMLAEPKVPLRIGIHSGDVITEGKNVYGDGVNVASRIESFAVAGSVFISGRVYDDIKNQKDIEAVSLGKFELKNVTAPMEIFAISNSGLIVPSKQKLEGKGRGVSKRKISSRKNLVTLGAIVLIFIAAIFFYNKFFAAAKFTGKEKSIAVLPFANMSNDKDNEYFSDGITEDIITRLSQITGLKVISRTSVMRFKNSTESIKEIASELGVAAILEGSVQKIGNQVRITAQLIDAGTDQNLWADKFDRELKDIFQIQSDVSEVIALRLNASLTAFQKSRIEKKPTENLEAYNFYLQGNYLWSKHTDESLSSAIEAYSKAIALDSNFAAAHAAISISWFSRGMMNDSVFRIIHHHAVKALSIDSNLASGHVALGEFYEFGNGDLLSALNEFNKAIKLDPNYAHAWTQKGFTYYQNGESDKALPYVNEALNLDPVTPNTLVDKAEILGELGKTDEAFELLRKAEALEPESNLLPEVNTIVYFHAGKYDEWIKLMTDYYSKGMVIRSQILQAKAIEYAMKNNKKESEKMIDSLSIIYGSPDSILIAGCKYLLNEREEAFQILQTFVGHVPDSNKNFLLADLLRFDFYLAPMRTDPRFDEIKKELGWKPLP